MGALSWVREYRDRLGFTQVELAVVAGVSLPTLQNIEMQKANPTWDVIEKLSSAMGLDLKIQNKPLNWALLVNAGVPLMSASALGLSHQDTHKKTRLEVLRAGLSLKTNPESLQLREREVLVAFFLALCHHYPSIFKHYKSVLDDKDLKVLESKLDRGRLIKLRRIALASLKKELL